MASARRRGQDGGMRLSIAWSPLYSGSNSKGFAVRSEGRPVRDPIRWPIAGAMNAENLFGQFGERSGRQSPIGGQMRQGALVQMLDSHHEAGDFPHSVFLCRKLNGEKG